MIAIFKREFKSYFATPVGFIFLTAFYFFLGMFFSVIYSGGFPNVEAILIEMSTVAVFAMPIITMRLMSEDRRQKVDQVLLTAPVKLTSIVMGKFLSAMALYALAFAPTVIFEIIIAANVSVNVFIYIYALLGMMLLGGVLIAIGMFISSLTESPAISAILSLVINILVLFMSSFANMITIPQEGEGFISKIWSKVVEYFVLFLQKAGFISVVQNFEQNIFVVADIVYFLSIIVLFIFLSVRSLEKRRWS